MILKPNFFNLSSCLYCFEVWKNWKTAFKYLVYSLLKYCSVLFSFGAVLFNGNRLIFRISSHIFCRIIASRDSSKFARILKWFFYIEKIIEKNVDPCFFHTTLRQRNRLVSTMCVGISLHRNELGVVRVTMNRMKNSLVPLLVVMKNQKVKASIFQLLFELCIIIFLCELCKMLTSTNCKI